MSFGSARGRCFVEISAETGRPIRIFRGRKGIWEKLADGNLLREWPKKDATESIRRQIFNRCGGYCELCSQPVTWDAGNMHERQHRGKGGEISLANSIFICRKCHQNEHKERNPQWKKQVQS